ncbi:3-hydroxybutyrate dehydrogenase/3-oxoacyl-[acyl-carrier protein] reductase [Altererythrobacter xiamenensis]|uniref:3-hydroxybutyrate dehydrogenase/3-oxoacyl-[acyl-carrier protein] reductase n=1 Tax=Altererythrobacter xiamenensis TaxID=1316679 RepID=A0A1Y6F2T2_9SPHN|nr:SDR family NAD(P)-dependent oxidoreductase [Altererythrobacter xiamenensis]SMQ69164.1 3-hydroxybutyrate dehydrogenase/3-oxoacyl-[acyl-carrier protein] reductase [Altererythrobacter xiamenensis]
MKLEGKVAAITGGTAGLGRGIAEAFLAEGAKVALFARNPEKGAKVLEEMGAGDDGLFVSGDVMNQSDVEGFIDKTVERFGTIDILVNNAGGAGDLQPMVDLSDETFDEAMKWNVYSTFWASRRALKTMIANKWGRIINMSSMEGKHGKPIFTAYTAAKHAVNGMTKSLAREVGELGVTANCICPGLVVTDIIKNNGPATAKAMGMEFDEMIAMFASESAIKRPNTVEEVAAVALLLASPEGAGITGAAISVDGGTAQY